SGSPSRRWWRSRRSAVICRIEGWISGVELAARMIWSMLMKRTGGRSVSDEPVAGGKTLGAPGYTEVLLGVDGLLVVAEPEDEPDDEDDEATRNLIVVHGVRMMSSWSIPNVFAPLGLSTPTTRKPTFWMRSSFPSGEAPWKSSRTMVCPTRHTRAAFRTS